LDSPPQYPPSMSSPVPSHRLHDARGVEYCSTAITIIDPKPRIKQAYDSTGSAGAEPSALSQLNCRISHRKPGRVPIGFLRSIRLHRFLLLKRGEVATISPPLAPRNSPPPPAFAFLSYLRALLSKSESLLTTPPRPFVSTKPTSSAEQPPFR